MVLIFESPRSVHQANDDFEPEAPRNIKKLGEGVKDLHYARNKIYAEHFKPMETAGHNEAAVCLAEMLYDLVAPVGWGFATLRAAMSVWKSLGKFAKEYLHAPLVKSTPDATFAKGVVKLATCPLDDGADKAWAEQTGWDRHECAGLRTRRQDPRQEQHTSGTLHKLRKRPKSAGEWLAKKVEAMQYWVRHTAPRNLGVGKRDHVSDTFV